MHMPFGKHFGDHVVDVPTQYLEWLLRVCDKIDPALRAAIAAELQARHGRRQGDADAPPQAKRNQVAHPGVSAWREAWREIVMRCHPDRGGDAELFKIMNRINEIMNPKGPS